MIAGSLRLEMVEAKTIYLVTIVYARKFGIGIFSLTVMPLKRFLLTDTYHFEALSLHFSQLLIVRLYFSHSGLLD